MYLTAISILPRIDLYQLRPSLHQVANGRLCDNRKLIAPLSLPGLEDALDK